MYTTQIMELLNNELNNYKYALHEGDIINVTVKNTNTTVAQQFKGFVYKITGNNNYTVSTNQSGLVTKTGSVYTIADDSPLATNDLNFTLYDKKGKTLKDGQWTNDDVKVVLSVDNLTNDEVVYFNIDSSEEIESEFIVKKSTIMKVGYKEIATRSSKEKDNTYKYR